MECYISIAMVWIKNEIRCLCHMIVTELNGGLGNQMFQYAAARRLAHLHETQLKLDVFQFPTYKLRVYELGHFNVNMNFVDYDDIGAFKENCCIKKFFLKLKNLFRSDKILEVKEKYFHFDESILYLSDNVYLRGYWQSEKCFKDIESIIRSDFSLREKLTNASEEIANLIRRSKVSVAIHIRRGDYVSNSTTNSMHGTCSLSYYQECVKELAEKFSDLQLFIFSDDPVWVQENLHYKYPTVFVSHNGSERAYEDMHLMSLCDHNIIANSSFSWWGAWLNNNPDKIVFAPKKWFRKDEINTKDLIPDNWIRV